jgi:hypothetical protein
MNLQDKINDLIVGLPILVKEYLEGDREKLFSITDLTNKITVLALELNKLSPMGGRPDENRHQQNKAD